MAFAAHDQGYDVFLANLRGNGERLHTEHNVSAKQYWDFSINEHAFLDIPSFIQVIRQVKIKELSNNNTEVIHNLAYNTFCGTSVKIYKHFWQLKKSKNFQAFDYGKQKNLEIYGTPYPLNFLDNYNLSKQSKLEQQQYWKSQSNITYNDNESA
eukprot:gene7794-9143_t